MSQFTPAALVADLTQPQLIALAKACLTELDKLAEGYHFDEASSKLEDAIGEYAAVLEKFEAGVFEITGVGFKPDGDYLYDQMRDDQMMAQANGQGLFA